MTGGCVWLEAVDATRNISRCYGIWVSRDLFGTKGQGRAVSFADGGEATRHIKALLNRRARAPRRIGVSYQRR